MGLLFYSFIARKKGYDVIYLGASIPTNDLVEVQRITNAKAMFSAYVNAIEKKELEDMFVHYRETFPTLHFYVTGLQIKDLNPALPHGFSAIPSAQVFKDELHYLANSN